MDSETEYMHVRIPHMHVHVCTQLFMNIIYIIIYGQDNIESNDMLNSIQII